MPKFLLVLQACIDKCLHNNPKPLVGQITPSGQVIHYSMIPGAEQCHLRETEKEK